MQNKPTIVFFGTSRFSALILDEMKKAGFIPEIVVTTPDKPQGRKHTLTPSPVKAWADTEKIPALLLDTLKSADTIDTIKNAIGKKADLFVVASYGKIIPKSILGIPNKGTLNVHPSLLPLLRGPSPIQSALLDNMNTTGVSIMLLDEEMDHGPILDQEEIAPSTWPIPYEKLETEMAEHGGKLLCATIPRWLADEIIPLEQNHSLATYTKKIEKEDGLLDLGADAYKNWLRFNAFSAWPGTYFFTERKGKKIRVIITDADFKDGTFEILKVKPEGKNEMPYADFMRGL